MTLLKRKSKAISQNGFVLRHQAHVRTGRAD